MKSRWQNYIDGNWCDSQDGEVIEVDNPATGKVFASIARGKKADIDLAVASARKAVNSRALYEMPPHERMRLMLRIASSLRDLAPEYIPVLVAENGKTSEGAADEIEETARYFEYYGGLAGKLHGRAIPLGKGYLDYTQLVPFGVVAHIIPWNFPFELAGRDVAPALACGNAVVIKSPELSPLTLCALALACERAGLPRGYVNLVCGYGHDAGEALASHPDIDHVTFTGSVATGRRVAANAAERLIPCVLELGGKGASIVYPDADMDVVVDGTGRAAFNYAGQVCSSGSRVIVHSSIHDRLVAKLQSWIGERTMGPGADGHYFTPMISANQRDKAENFCLIAKQQGAVTVTGGRRSDDLPGYFLKPTILTNVKPLDRVNTDEIFGPVLSVLSFDEPEEALAIANGVDYGLAAGVYTSNLSRAHWTADHLESGTVFINGWYIGGMEVPFGGFKRSGYGRVKSVDGLGNYSQIRNVAVRL